MESNPLVDEIHAVILADARKTDGLRADGRQPIQVCEVIASLAKVVADVVASGADDVQVSNAFALFMANLTHSLGEHGARISAVVVANDEANARPH